MLTSLFVIFFLWGDTPQDDVIFGEAANSVAPLEQTLTERIEEKNKTYTLGGQLFLRGQTSLLKDTKFEHASVQSPNLLDVFVDARPSERIRAMMRGRVKYDPSIQDGSLNMFGQPQKPTMALLDQLWLKTDIVQKVFVTVGRQPIRWGTGRFWNPTDFMIQQRRDPLTVFDERVGVHLLKLHMPIEKRGFNFYAVGNFDHVSSLKNIGGALRGEFVFGNAELSLTTAYRHDKGLQLGCDLSVGVGLIDFRWETAVTKNNHDQVKVGSTFGAEMAFKYNDQDSLLIGVEFFYNGSGYSNARDYVQAYVQGTLVPFYMGQYYASSYINLMAPGSWDLSNFTLSYISNVSDCTHLIRLDGSYKALTYLDLNAYVVYHFGKTGELHFNTTADVGAGVRAYF